MLRVFQPSSDRDELIEFDSTIAIKNYRKGRQTSIIFDTNVLIDIDSAYRTKSPHSKLKEAGIVQFIKLIAKNSKYGIFISPGAAYRELPPARRAPVEAALSRMLKYYLPTFSYDPNATNLPFEDEGDTPEEFSELPSELQEFKSYSYASLLAMNIIYNMPTAKPIEKLNIYIDYCSEVLNLISLKELTIARYVFAPDKGITDSLRMRKNAIVNNFTKIKRGVGKRLSLAEAIKRISLNGANDLIMVTSADVVNNTRERYDYTPIAHDVWIATSDEKLYEFCRACPSILFEDSKGTMARAMDAHYDITGTRYWKESAETFSERLEERRGKADFNTDMSVIVQAALQTEALLLKGDAEKFFETRSWRSRP